MGWATLSAAANRVALARLGSVSVVAGAVSGEGFLAQNSELILGGEITIIDYLLTVPTEVFGGLGYGDQINVDGIEYKVEHQPMRFDDGTLCRVPLIKLAPDATAPGSNPHRFGLTDLADVELTSPTAGEVLKYNGTLWVDGADEGAGYVYTQSTAASTWTINHNLGFVPSVEVFDAGSQEIEAGVSHSTVNTTVIMFTLPTAGFARLT